LTDLVPEILTSKLPRGGDSDGLTFFEDDCGGCCGELIHFRKATVFENCCL